MGVRTTIELRLPRLPRIPIDAMVVLAIVLGCGIAAQLDVARAEVWTTVAMLVGFGYGGGAAIVRARRLDGRRRLAWSLVGGGLALGAVGLTVFGSLSAAGVNLPVYGPLDLFFIGAYGLLLGGLVLMPHAGGTLRQRIVVWIDGLVGAVSIFTLSWVWLLSSVVGDAANRHGWERVIGVMFPVVDVMLLIAVATMVLRRTSLRFDVRLTAVAAGMLLQSLADLLLVASTAGGGSLNDGRVAFPFFIGSAACMTLVGALADREPRQREYAYQKAPWWSLVSPYATASVMVLVFLTELAALQTQGADGLLVLAVASTGVAVATIARQAVAIAENRTRVESERREMVSSLSHEMRTPLTSAVGFVDLIRSGAVEGSEREELMDVVGNELEYLSRIVCDLVLLAREDPGAMKLKRGKADVRSIVEASMASPNLASLTDVVVDVQEGMIANVDPQRIGQAVASLATNAARYGGPRVAVAAFARRGDMVVEVHDDGHGVPPRYQLAIWERFERGAHRFDATQPGSGIGLALVKAIACAHGGSAEYRRSERLGGACFSLTVPGAVEPWKTSLPSRSGAAGGLPTRPPSGQVARAS